MNLPYDKDEHALIFLHIGKSAGSTLGTIIDRQYANDRLFVVMVNDDNEVFKALPEAQRARIDMLRGMTYYGIHRAIPRASRYFTMVRNPVDRIISQYFYNHRRKQRAGHTPRRWPVEEFLERLPFHAQLQLALIVGGDNKPDSASQPLDRSHLAVANAHLAQHFSLVGTLERFDESLVLMKQRFGWNNIAYARRNTAPENQRDRLKPHELKLFEDACTLELEFYEGIKNAFDAELRDQPPAFARDLETLRRNSRFYRVAWNASASIRETSAWRAFRRRFWPTWTPSENEADA